MITLPNCDLESVQLYNNVCYMFVMYCGNQHFNYLNTLWAQRVWISDILLYFKIFYSM